MRKTTVLKDLDARSFGELWLQVESTLEGTIVKGRL